MTFKNLFQTQIVSKIMLGIGILLVVLLIFQAGIYFGARKASFACHWDNAFFGRNNDPRSPLAPFRRFDPINPHGVVGSIVSVRLPSMMVRGDRSSDEEIVNIGPETIIRRFRENASTTDLLPGQDVIVVGESDETGGIRASLIRIMPESAFPGITPGMMRK